MTKSLFLKVTKWYDSSTLIALQVF